MSGVRVGDTADVASMAQRLERSNSASTRLCCYGSRSC